MVDCFALIVFLVSCGCWCYVSILHGSHNHGVFINIVDGLCSFFWYLSIIFTFYVHKFIVTDFVEMANCITVSKKIC